MTRLYDIEQGLREMAAVRASRGDLALVLARVGDDIADGFRADFDTTLDMETVGKALVIAAASVTRLAADKRRVPATVVVNMIGLAGENLVRTARARAAETVTVGETGPVWMKPALTWHPVTVEDVDPVDVPLNKHIVWNPEELGEFKVSMREVSPGPVSDDDVVCPHPHHQEDELVSFLAPADWREQLRDVTDVAGQIHVLESWMADGPDSGLEAFVVTLHKADRLGYLAPSDEWMNGGEPLPDRLQHVADRLAEQGRIPNLRAPHIGGGRA